MYAQQRRVRATTVPGSRPPRGRRAPGDTNVAHMFVEGFYSTTRRHSTLGNLSPAQFETKINKDNG